MLLRLALLAVLALAALVIGLWLARPTHRINREAFARITNGMTKEEVKAL